MPKIFIVEDDPEIGKQLSDWLERERHNVEVCTNGADALAKMLCSAFDLVILDWELPQLKGIEVLRQFREAGGKTPVMMLTAHDTLPDLEKGLQVGADDYLKKPFHVREVSARVHALLRRDSKKYEQILKIGDFELDTDRHSLTRDGEPIKLQPMEFAVLEFLVRNSPEIFSVEALLTRVWNSESESSPDTVRVCIAKLRNKLSVPGKPPIIKTVHRLGYQIELE